MVTSSGETTAARAGAAFAAYRSGDVQQMDELVELLTPLLWHTARGIGLEAAAAQDVVQQAWLRLVEKADDIRDPRAVMGWLLVTVRRESWRVAKVAGRADTELDEELPDTDADPAELSVLAESDGALWRQVSSLSPRCRALLRVIAFADRPDYAHVAQSLGMPIGSIGPTRGRCLAKLRAALLTDPQWVTS
ncbi:RNA polymerase sigma factor [Janibacter sp. G1551]|uniref:RNA polymerase sigma factor n=1 Tax=Janibacter sp. G1551 TaxID=3420440 RepID=UPI003D03A997